MILVAICLGLFIVQLDTTVVNLALPSIQASLGSNVSTLQWIVDAYNLAIASLLLSGGALGDLYGRRRLFLIGQAIFTLSSIACGIAPSSGILLAARAIQGVGA